jgi:hypothetical protein
MRRHHGPVITTTALWKETAIQLRRDESMARVLLIAPYYVVEIVTTQGCSDPCCGRGHLTPSPCSGVLSVRILSAQSIWRSHFCTSFLLLSTPSPCSTHDYLSKLQQLSWREPGTTTHYVRISRSVAVEAGRKAGKLLGPSVVYASGSRGGIVQHTILSSINSHTLRVHTESVLRTGYSVERQRGIAFSLADTSPAAWALLLQLSPRIPSLHHQIAHNEPSVGVFVAIRPSPSLGCPVT